MFIKSLAVLSLSLLGSVAAQSSTSSSDPAVKTHAFSVGAVSRDQSTFHETLTHIYLQDGRTFTPHSQTVPVGDILGMPFEKSMIGKQD